MVTLGFQFPAGRYHATPWGHQVNEGLVEWPASPWRLLRALLSSGFTRLGWDNSPPKLAIPLFEALCSKSPSYFVPQTNISHSRHYMPTATFRSGTQIEATTLVLDTWANVGDGEMQVSWDVELSVEQRELLSSLVEHMNYLGRSESWAIGRLLDDSNESSRPNVVPHQPGVPLERGYELVTLIAPVAPADYTAWRVERLPEGLSNGKKKLTTKQLKDQEHAEAPYPRDLLEAMQWDTSRWQSFGWSQPPGSQLVQYRRPRDTLAMTAAPVPALHEFGDESADIVLLALSTDSGSLGLLPSITRTLPQAELLHDAMVRLASVDGQVPPEELTGRDINRKPLEGHRHAHVLPIDLDEDGHVDHVILWAKMGFSRCAQEAVSDLRRTWTKGGKAALRLALAGRALQKSISNWPNGMARILGSSTYWESETPFVAPRFLKQSGKNTLEGQIRAELNSRGFSEPLQVVASIVPPSGTTAAPRTSLFRHFIRARARGGQPPPQQSGWFVQIEFAQAVEGPLCLGYASHFGLGMFRGVNGFRSRMLPPGFK